MDTANTLDEHHEVIKLLQKIVPYKNTITLLEQCYMRALWTLWISKEVEASKEDFEEAAEEFSSLGDYNAAASLAKRS